MSLTDDPVDVTQRSHVRQVRLDGEYDLRRTDELRVSLLGEPGSSIDADTAAVVVDMTDVTFIDSSAIRVFVEVRNTLGDADRELVLRSIAPAPRRVFEITGLAELFRLA